MGSSARRCFHCHLPVSQLLSSTQILCRSCHLGINHYCDWRTTNWWYFLHPWRKRWSCARFHFWPSFNPDSRYLDKCGKYSGCSSWSIDNNRSLHEEENINGSKNSLTWISLFSLEQIYSLTPNCLGKFRDASLHRFHWRSSLSLLLRWLLISQ